MAEEVPLECDREFTTFDVQDAAMLVGAAGIVLLSGLAGALLLASLGADLNHVSGAWTAHAVDLKNGILYRPLLSPDFGYGGTRYMPLHFVLHAALMRVVSDAILAGLVLSALETLALVCGMFALLRLSHVPVWPALCFSSFLLAGTSVQYGLTTIRGDVLPAALTVWGLAAVVAGARNAGLTLVAAVLLTLAFASKLTSVHGAIAGVLWLVAAGHTRRGIRMGLLILAGATGVLVATTALSDGRFPALFLVCAPGGATWSTLFASPARLLGSYVHEDLGGLLFAGLAVAIFLALRDWRSRGLPVLLFGSTLAVTLVIFGSPGTGSNHLLDLHVASVFAIAVSCSTIREPVAKRLMLASACVFGVLSMGPLAERLLTPPPSRMAEIRSILELTAPTRGTLLSEDPLVPIAGGRSPYVMDAFMVRLVGERYGGFSQVLFDRIRRQEFGAIVLLHDPDRPVPRGWYETMHFGHGFSDAVRERYDVVRRGRYYVVCMPRR